MFNSPPQLAQHYCFRGFLRVPAAIATANAIPMANPMPMLSIAEPRSIPAPIPIDNHSPNRESSSCPYSW